MRNAYKAGELDGLSAQLGAFVDANWLNFFRTFQMSMLIFVLFFIVMGLIVANTKYGRYVYAIGSNASGARQAGINTPKYTLMTYAVCSVSAALGALLFLGRAPYAKSDYGQMWELDAIAAVVIGGTSLFGGRGSLWGTFMGVILLKLINNGLTLAQLDTFWQMVVTGMIILVAVGLDIVRQSRDPEAVRKLLAAIAAVMAFFTLMTPASVYLRAKITLLEHFSAATLSDSGAKLAPGQTNRLLSPSEVSTFQDAINLTFMPSLLFLLLTLVCTFAIANSSRNITFLAAAAMISGIVPLIVMSYQVAIPFVILGAAALCASLIVHMIFARAKALRG